MLEAGIRILNLDQSVTAQVGFAHAESALVVDLSDVGPAARLWANPAQREIIRGRLLPAHRGFPTLIGSGDFHYISALLIEQFTEPLTVIVFDHHPDWDRLPPHYGCGAWVNRALELPQVRQVIQVGNASDDLIFPGAITGNRPAVRNGRLALVPWRLPASGYWPRPRLPARELYPAPDQVFQNQLQQVPTRNVYVSIDKDCLRSAHALTNWEEGCLELDFLLRSLRSIAAQREIVGLDITGDFSPVQIPTRWKSLCSRIDHPKLFTARGRSAEDVARINGDTTAQILASLNLGGS